MLFVVIVSYGLCTTFRTVLVIMAFVNEKAVDAEFFKGDDVILLGLIVELIQLSLNGTAAFFKLFYRELILSASAQSIDAVDDLIELCL